MDYSNYFKNYQESITFLLKNVDVKLINKSVNLIKKIKENNQIIYIVGNGGSASIASHVCVDFTKAAGITSVSFNNSNLITCYANDYGYENWVTESIKSYCKNDLVILISSSGKSPNIVNAAKYCNKQNIELITFSGFDPKNPLRKLGNVNFYVDSNDYNFVEMTHHIILVSIVDIFSKNLI